MVVRVSKGGAMVYTGYVELSTRGHADMHDLTPQVEQILTDCEVQIGTVTVFTPSSTSAITTIEYELAPWTTCGGHWMRLPRLIEIINTTFVGVTATVTPTCALRSSERRSQSLLWTGASSSELGSKSCS